MGHPRANLGKEDGAVLIITAFIFIALLGVAALVIDIVNIHQAKLRVQATADASVLAAAYDISDIDAAVEAGQDYAWRNYGVTDGDWGSCVDPNALAVATSVACISVDDADDPQLIRIKIPERHVPAFFATVLGRDSFTVSAAAIAQVEYVQTSEGGSNPGVDPNAPSVRDSDSGGWVTTETGEGCPDNWWVVDPPADDGSDDGKKKKKKKNDDQWREYIFVFEHTDGRVVVWCDTNRYGRYTGMIDMYGNEIGGTKETLLPGGTDTEEPYSMALAHVSCSGNWDSGWSTKDHPTEADDPEWRVIFYRLDRRSGDGESLGIDYIPCESNNFGAVHADPPEYEPIIRLYE